MKTLIIISVLLLLSGAIAFPQVPPKLSYQGVLTSGGGPVADGDYRLTFRIWDDISAGTTLWTETQSSVPLEAGSFSVILGSATSLGDFNFNRDLFLEVTVDSGPPGPTYPLSPFPRSLLTSSPSALGPWTVNGGSIHYDNGSVGIGTGSPTAKLHIAGTPGVDGIRYPDGTLQTSAAPGGGGGWTDDGSAVRLTTISDNVGIGTNTPTQKLEVAGTVYSTAGGFRFPNGTVQTTAAFNGISGNGTTNYVPKFLGPTTLGPGSLFDSAGILGIGTTTPSSILEIASNNLPGSYLTMTTASDFGSWPGIRFNRARGTLGARASVVDEDGMGSLNFYGFDGSSYVAAASIQGLVSGSPVAGDVPGKIYFRTNESGGTTGTKIRMVVEENGNVGINTIAPPEVLSVGGVVHSITGGFRFPDGTVQTTAANGGGSSGWTDDGPVVRLTNSFDKVGIHTTSPAADLDVVGAGTFRQLAVGAVDTNVAMAIAPFTHLPYSLRVIQVGNSAPIHYAGYFYALGSAATNIAGYFSATGATTANFAVYAVGGNNYFAGNVGIGTSTPTQKLQVIGNICATGTIGACSDLRYKERITPLSSSLEKVAAMNGVNYYWRRDEFPEQHFTDGKQIGLIAQEVEEVCPEVVMTDRDGYKSVDYARLAPVLIEAIKEQQAEIVKLRHLVESMAADHGRRAARPGSGSAGPGSSPAGK